MCSLTLDTAGLRSTDDAIIWLLIKPVFGLLLIRVDSPCSRALCLGWLWRQSVEDLVRCFSAHVRTEPSDWELPLFPPLL